MRAISLSVVFCVSVLLSVGCAVSYKPARPHSAGYSFSIARKAAETALSLIGTPYRFGGETPSGFDCSGLVRYSYRRAGLNVPRTTYGLRQRTHPVSSRDIRKGDLVFFTQLGKKYSHVGISIGGGRFVHAPSSGKHVRIDSLADRYWKKHFLSARRF